jgi:hypothetical protein
MAIDFTNPKQFVMAGLDRLDPAMTDIVFESWAE